MPGTNPTPDWTPAHTPPKTIPWRTIFRVIRWSTYVSAAITIAMVLHKAPPPVIETNPQAAARVEQKFEQVQQAVSAGQPAEMRMDQTELNSYLLSHLDIAANPDSTQAHEAAPATPNTVQAAPPANGANATSNSSGLDMPVPAGTSAEQIEQVRSQVKDVKVELVDDHVRAYVVFDMHGKDVTLQLEGKLGAQDGYLNFEPVSGQIGSLPLPPSALQSAMRHILENPENREKFKLPADMSDLKIVNGEVVATYK
jgi:hypothetical protein